MVNIVANDGFLPKQLTKRGHRLAFSNGIIFISSFAIILVIASKASITTLAAIYALAVFIGFALTGFGMAKKNRNTQGQANFLNACLRRFLRERDALVLACDGAVADTHGNAVKPEASKHGLVAKWNHPLWWIELLQRDYPEQWQSILETNNQAAPMAVRVNVQRTSLEALLAQWEQVGLAATPVGDYGLILDKARAVQDIPGFADGLWSVQDPAAQCPSHHHQQVCYRHLAIHKRLPCLPLY
jgi:hypothetical protein